MGPALFFAQNASLILTKPREGWDTALDPILQT